LQPSLEDTPGRRRGWRLAAASLALAAALAVLVFALTSGSDASPAYGSPTLALAKEKLGARLHQRMLRPHWIACVASGNRYRGAAVVRCNVNFGDPHIQAYCTVLHGEKLVTQYDDAQIPCGHDNAGWNSPVQTLN
jgi:hypothetical protein